MAKGSLRDQMPQVAAWVDGLRDVFGRQEIDDVIRRGLKRDCDPRDRVLFREGGYTIGQGLPAEWCEVSVKQMVIGPQPVVKKRGRE